MKRLLSSLVIMLICAAFCAGAKPDSNKVKKQQKQAQTEIKKTNEKIKKTDKQLSAELNKLDRMHAEIGECSTDIAILNTRVDSINVLIAGVNDSLAVLDKKIEQMRNAYAKSLKSVRRSRRSMSNLTFLFSADNFSQAFRRARALNEFNRWRSRRNDEISAIQTRMQERRDYLSSLQQQASEALTSIATRKAELQLKQRQTDDLVSNLKTQRSQLDKLLKEQQTRAKKLDDELNRIIAEERAEAERKRIEEEKRKKAEEGKNKGGKTGIDSQKDKNADKNGSKTEGKKGNDGGSTKAGAIDIALAKNFAEARGQLGYPVERPHKIIRHFGITSYQDVSKMSRMNNGISIEANPGAAVKCVFDGEVSRVILFDDYNYIVIVSHGNYRTVYINLESVNVRKGDKVKRNQVIGKVYSDGILQFEIRRESDSGNVKENPEQWLKG